MQKTRNFYLDLLKMIGSFSIIFLHLNTTSLHSACGSISELQKIIVHTLHQLFYTAVPVFMMATGAGFLGTDNAVTYKKIFPYIIKIIPELFTEQQSSLRTLNF